MNALPSTPMESLQANTVTINDYVSFVIISPNTKFNKKKTFECKHAWFCSVLVRFQYMLITVKGFVAHIPILQLNKPLVNKIRIFFLIFGNHKVLCVGATPIIRPPLKYTNLPYPWTGREYQEKENMRRVFRDINIFFNFKYLVI